MQIWERRGEGGGSIEHLGERNAGPTYPAASEEAPTSGFANSGGAICDSLHVAEMICQAQTYRPKK
jgi:hypothetical protein